VSFRFGVRRMALIVVINRLAPSEEEDDEEAEDEDAPAARPAKVSGQPGSAGADGQEVRIDDCQIVQSRSRSDSYFCHTVERIRNGFWRGGELGGGTAKASIQADICTKVSPKQVADGQRFT
jgi:hypothetical protein